MPELLSSQMPPAVSDLIPERHLTRLAGLRSPRVVIVGDSISTPSPNYSHDMLDTFWGHFQRAFLLANPGLEPEFINRAIGAANFARFAKFSLEKAQGSNMKLPWATNPDEQWLDHVERLEPDLLIQAFGMNDAGSFDTAGFQDLQSRIDSWDKQPDRIYIPTMLPSRESDRKALSSEQAQLGRQYVAHYVRSWAIYYGYAIIDLNRVQSQTVQGFDPRVSDMELGKPSRATLPARLRQASQDFGFVVAGDTLGPDLKAGIAVELGNGTKAAADQAMLRIQWEGDAVTLSFSDTRPRKKPYLVRRHAMQGAGEPQRLSIFVKDVFAHVELDGERVFFGRIRRHGGPFKARVFRLDGQKSTSTVRLFTSRFRQHAPVLSDIEAYGAQQPLHLVTGGNFRNHPSSLMASHVFATLLEATRLTVPGPVPK